MRAATHDLEALRTCVVRVRWDGAEAAIELPLSDLFNASSALPTHTSDALSAQLLGAHTMLELRLPMPFAHSADFRFENRGQKPLALSVITKLVSGVPKEPWGHLHVRRQESSGAPPHAYHPLVSEDGRGRLVGVCGQFSGAVGRDDAPFFLEGDVELTIDGRVKRGTGTEDYFNAAFFFADGQTASPFHQVWGNAQHGDMFGVSACRWHVLSDAIDFRESLDARLEIGPTTKARYVTMAYTYREPADPSQQP